MRTLCVIALVVTLGQFIEVGTTVSPLAAQDRVADILKEVRQALGGDDKVAAVKAVTAEGPFRRAMGQMSMEGTVTLTIARPDKMRRVEEFSPAGMVGGPVMERTQMLNGNVAWDESANRGGMGGGMQMVIRTDGAGGGAGAGGRGGPPPPPPPGGGAVINQGPGSQMTPEQLMEARVRRSRVTLQRYMAALFAEAPTPFVDGGIAESPDGKADILESKDDTGRTLRLFVDQATHLPLMVQYQDPKPMIMIAGGPGGPGRGPGAPGGAGPMTPEQKQEMQKRAEEMRAKGPQMGTFAIHLGEYKKVGNVMLPHKIDISIDGEPNEEWTVEKYQINPTLKASDWEQKK